MFARIAIRLLCIKVCYNFMFVTQFLKRQGSNAPSVISHIPKVIYERVLTTKPVKKFGITPSVYIWSLLSNTQFTLPTAEILGGKNAQAFLVCGFFMKIVLKKVILKI